MIIILHSEYSRESRALVATIPAEEAANYCVVNWYDHSQEGHVCDCLNGQPYDIPISPSAFPELIFRDENPPPLSTLNEEGEVVEIEQLPGWARIRAAQSLADVNDRSKIDTRVPDQGETP